MRASILPEYAGVAFTALGDANELTKGELGYAREVAEEASRQFIAADTKIAPADQLAFNHAFSRAIGLTVPELTDEQRRKLFDAAAAQPDWRILAVPLLDPRERQDIAERARRVLPNDFGPDAPVIRPPDDGTVIRELTETDNLEGTAGRDGREYVIRYRAPGGWLLPRSAYTEDLLAGGAAVSGADGLTWMFLVGDVRTYANDGFPIGLGRADSDWRIARREIDPEFYAETYRAELLQSRLNAGELYQRSWREFPPTEALIVMILMHNAAREPNRTYDINLANETVHELTPDGGVEERPRYLTTVRFRTQDHRIGLYARECLSRRDYFYVRPFINALDH